MSKKSNLDILNSLYQPLYQKASLVCNHLLEKKINAKLNWFNGHSIKIEDEYYYEYYPIPIIEIQNIDIGFSFSGIFIDVTCSKNIATSLNYPDLEVLSNFEIYDGNDYLKTILNSSNNIINVIQNIKSDNIHIAFEIEDNNHLGKIIQIIDFFIKQKAV